MARRGPLSQAKRKREADKRAKREMKQERRAKRNEERRARDTTKPTEPDAGTGEP